MRFKFFLGVVVVALALAYFMHKRSAIAANRSKIVALTDSLKSQPLNKTELGQLLNGARANGLTVGESDNLATVETPLEFGATDWILYIDFKNSSVSGYRVRSVDSMIDHPKGAPPDWLAE